MTDANAENASASPKAPAQGEDAIYLVTGGGGFIGSHLVDLIRRERPEATIRVLDNFVTGQTVPNLVVVKVGDGGLASIFNNSGNAHVIADVVGWYG